MLTISPVKLNTNYKKYVSFGENHLNNVNSKVGVMSLDKNPASRVYFEQERERTKEADLVRSKNLFKGLFSNVRKAYNILVTPTRNNKTESTYIHVPYMA